MAGNESLRDVTLRPWPAQKKEELSQDDLLLQIEQLTTERGHLRDITESSLQHDIEAGKDVPEDSKDGGKQDDKAKDAPSKQQVDNAQREMYTHLEYVYFFADYPRYKAYNPKMGQVCSGECARPSLPNTLPRYQQAGTIRV